MENKAAYLTAPTKPLCIQDAPLPHLEPDEVLIQNHALAVNPLDYKQQDSGVLIDKFPYVCFVPHIQTPRANF